LLGFISEAPKSVELNLQALTLAQSLGDTWRQAKAFTFLGWTDGYDFKKRVGYWEKAISLFRRVSDLRFLAGQLATLGNFLALNGDIEPAQKCLDESTLLLQQLNSKNLIWHNNKGGYVQIALMRGDYDQARALLQAIQNLSQENGDRMTYLWTRVRLAYLDLHDGKISEARHAFSENAQSFQKNENTIGVVFTLEGMAKLCVTAGKPERAAQLIGWTDTTREEISDMRPLLEQADVDKIISACLAKMGETAFSDAYEEGQKMTLDEAVAYALSES
jgi:tetratricopeptide (TPR) repeat protein